MKFLFCIFVLFSTVFRQISTDNGLSQVTVSSITKDSNGYIWFGTADGLNRYDGSGIKVFRHDKNDKSSLCANYITSLSTDNEGKLIVCTDKGISFYDPKNENFRSFRSSAVRCIDVRTFGYDGKGLNYLVEDDRGLILTDLNGKSKRISTSLHLSMSPENRNAIYAFAKNVLYLVNSDFSVKEIFAFNRDIEISSVLDDGKGLLYVGTDYRGLAIVSLKDRSVRFITTADGLSSNTIRKLAKDNEGKIWITTAYNLSIFNPGNSGIEVIRHEELSPESISGYSLRAIFSDGEGGIWIGTYYGGVNYYHPNLQRFHNITYLNDGKSISDRVIRSLAVDREGKIWVGTSRSGIFKLDPNSESVLRMAEFGSSGETALNAVAFHNDGNRILLGKSQSPLQCYRLQQLTFSEFSNVKWVVSIGRISDSQYLVSSLDGLFLVYPETGKAIKLRINRNPDSEFSKKANCITVDGSGKIWLGLKQGLARCVLDNKDEANPSLDLEMFLDSLPQAQQVLETKDKFWVASSSGLGCIDKNKMSVSLIDTENGLPSQIVRSIEEDEFGRLWLGTEKGLVCYNPSTREIRVYGSSDGVENSKFNPYAHCKGSDGTLYFGGIKGITCITPSLVGTNTYSPDPVITGIYVNGKERLVNSPLVRLHHSERNIDISFNTIDFVSGKSTRYEYMMEDVDDNWRTADGSHKATYTNIPKGKHIFTVRSFNDSGVPCQNPGRLTIQVAPVWYDTIAFKLVCLVLFLIGIYIAFIYLRKRFRRKLNAARQEEIKKIKENALNTKLNSLRVIPGHLSDKDRDFFSKVIGIIEDNISNENLSVQMIADQMQMSRSNLHIRIRAIAGRTVLDIINQCKMEKAIILLDQSKLTISEIAYATGFSSPAYFSTCFKEKYGITPSEWIKTK